MNGAGLVLQQGGKKKLDIKSRRWGRVLEVMESRHEQNLCNILSLMTKTGISPKPKKYISSSSKLFAFVSRIFLNQILLCGSSSLQPFLQINNYMQENINKHTPSFEWQVSSV